MQDVHLLLGLISDGYLGVEAGDLERSSLFVSLRRLRILASSSYLRLSASELAAEDLDLGADMTRLRELLFTSSSSSSTIWLPVAHTFLLTHLKKRLNLPACFCSSADVVVLAIGSVTCFTSKASLSLLLVAAAAFSSSIS